MSLAQRAAAAHAAAAVPLDVVAAADEAVSAVVGTYAPQWRGVACVQLAVAAMPLVVMKEGGEKWGGLEG